MTTAVELLKHRARIHPNFLALEDESHTYTYEEFHRYSNQLAHYLKELGVNPGDRIAVLSRNHSAVPIILFASAKIGAITVPLNSRLSSSELSWIINNCEAKVLFYEDNFDLLVNQEIHSSMDHLISFGSHRSIESIGFSYPTEFIHTSINESDTFIIIYTSGTTGNPKGVMISHRNLIFVSRNFAIDLDIQLYDRFLLPTPLFHISGIMFNLLSIIKGMTLVLQSRFHPVEIWDVIHEKKINSMMAVPTLLNLMLPALKQRESLVPTLRNIYCGGTQIPATVIHDYANFGYAINQIYALTETSCYLTRWYHGFGMKHCDSLGKPSYLVDLEIRDPETNESLPAGEIGEIVTRGEHIFQGYWNNPEETAEVYRDGWFHTQDLGYLNEDGFLYILDRMKDMIATGGEKVYPAQIEAILLQQPEVQEAAVIGVKHPLWMEIPRAYIVLKPESTLSEEEILAFVHDKISAYKLQQVRFVDSLPKNGMGKILKSQLREEANREEVGSTN